MAQSFLAGKKGIIIPLALGLVALLLTFQYISQREKALGLMAEPVPVLVAKQDLPRLTRLDEAVVEVRQVPRQYLQPGALTAVKEAHNQVTNTPMLKGEQVLGTKLVAYGVETGLAIKVPKGLRGVTLSVNDVSGLAGLIQPGNFVDVMGTFEFGDLKQSNQKTFTIFQNVLVLAVGQTLGLESEAARALTQAEREKREGLSGLPSGIGGLGRTEAVRTVTLALDPGQAQGLVVAQASGQLSLVLRSLFEGRETAPLAPVSLETLLGVRERVMFQPNWREIRGSEQNR
ncbi:MAG: Flp pilus assembly protein CpaB [Desulfarculus sp.]|nr:Flp pilus assembly protein CpaB [Desulfarculus sp.]